MFQNFGVIYLFLSLSLTLDEKRASVLSEDLMERQ